jgi:type I protein arginine methyltransferase
MSLHLPSSGNHVPDQGPGSPSPSGSEEEYDEDQVWDDFAEDSIAQQPCFSLFEDKKFPSATEAMENDRSKHDFDLDDTCTRLGKFLSFSVATLS